jgi:hypothetical protein
MILDDRMGSFASFGPCTCHFRFYPRNRHSEMPAGMSQSAKKRHASSTESPCQRTRNARER